MKTGMNWFNKMNRKEKRRFKKEFIKSNGINYFNYFLLKSTFEVFKDFIHGSFVFMDTKQGFKYWDELSQKYNQR